MIDLLKLMGQTTAVQIRLDNLRKQLADQRNDLMVVVRLDELQHNLDVLINELNVQYGNDYAEGERLAFEEYVRMMETDGVRNQYQQELL